MELRSLPYGTKLSFQIMNSDGANAPLFYSSTPENSTSEQALTETQSESIDAYWTAREACKAKDYHTAMKYLDQALERDPENAAALMRSSIMHSSLANYDTAISYLKRAQAVLRKQGKNESADNLESGLESLKDLRRENVPPSITL
ncbi:MAG: tetratricopeptide repeat protein [Leptolyngbya sp. SIOISBB]|nr:tetratricopeptide repeat protein [Leptolyngbya sp. SIOISBB]